MIPTEAHDQFEIPEVLPVVPVRDRVVYPYTIVPLLVSRPLSVFAVEEALADQRMVLLVAQKQAQDDLPGSADLYPVGTVGLVLRSRRLEDGRLKILVQGLVRGRLDKLVAESPHLRGRMSPIFSLPLSELSLETEATMRALSDRLKYFSELVPVPGPDVLVVLQGMQDPGRLADLVASNLPLKVEDSQQVLQSPDPIKRLRLVADLLQHEIDLVQTKNQIEDRVKEKMGKTQREYLLREQMKQIHTELGEDPQDDELAELQRRIEQSDMPDKARVEANKQWKRLAAMHTESAEAGTIRTYLDCLLELTWQRLSQDRLDLVRAKEILDRDHLGLDEAKDRVLEFLGVKKLNPENPGAILLLVGPPGVGKTSLGKAIAQALSRPFVRVSLGGIRDGAEIYGHRRTYIGSMPGRIMQGMKQADCINPVFLLDEIDKLGRDFSGDPAAALLEVLDPEQNGSFTDHYLNLPFDLSKVMFIATANRVDTIAGPLLDRMEEIYLPGYSCSEKMTIARQHLLPEQLTRAGLQADDLQLDDEVLLRIIERHTRESGLRNLERALAQICRKVARRFAEGHTSRQVLSLSDLRAYLGPTVHHPTEQDSEPPAGVVNGLAWTPVGGEILSVEVLAMAGRGQLILTGQLGEVMKESAQAALSYARSRADALGFNPEYFSSHDIHIHVPAGSIPKDGPSAGVTMTVALFSLLSGVPIPPNIAMTGEITLSGRLLPIGGIREKLLAALSAGIKEVFLPTANDEDLVDLPTEITTGLVLHQSATVESVLARLLGPKAPAPRSSVPRLATGQDPSDSRPRSSSHSSAGA